MAKINQLSALFLHFTFYFCIISLQALKISKRQNTPALCRNVKTH
jgi:hypothetical protein